MKVKLLISLVCVISLAVAVFYFPELRYDIHGIDISHHQNRIEWDHVDTSYVKFAYIKATEGSDFQDSLFVFNRSGATGRGIPVGAYHFFTFLSSGKDQARNFIETVGLFDSTQLIPVIDLEFGGNSKTPYTPEELHRELTDFVNELVSAGSQPPIIYITPEAEKVYRETVSNYRTWVRSILIPPELVYQREWDIHQYWARGSIDGVEGPVDLNGFCGDDFQTLFNRTE